MLVGSLEYRNKDGYIAHYNLTGVDTSTTLSLKMESPMYKDINLMANDDAIDDGYAIDSRRVDISLARVAVETGKQAKILADGTVSDKLRKSDVNHSLFCRFAALMRYAKRNCLVKNQIDYTGIALASGEFEVSKTRQYVINKPDGSHLADITLFIGDIIDLSLETEDFKVELHEDASVFQEQFPRIVDGFTWGIKFDEFYLGFKPAEATPIPANVLNTSNGMYTCIEEIVQAYPHKSFDWLLQKDYRIVTDDTLEEVCKYIMDWDGYVYYDTETTGLNINFKSRYGQADQLVGVIFSVKYGESFYFPLQMKHIDNLCNGDHWYVMEHYLRPILEGKDLVTHNASFDWKVSYIYDINANIVHDTMAIIKLTLGAEKKNFPAALKELAALLLGRDSLELSDLIINNAWGETDIKFWDLPAELVRLYACADTDNTNGLLQYAIQEDLLNRYGAAKIYEIEIAFTLAVGYQEFYGHRIDTDNLENIRKEVMTLIEENMNEMVKIVGHTFNPNSSPQLLKIMYEELGIPKQISRKTNRPTADKETLKKLSEITDIEGNIKYPFCKYMMEYRAAEGVRKIIDSFPEVMTEDGFIFSEVQQYGTTTGRVSIKKPNYQSYNDPVKKNVIPRQGYYMFDTDYSSVEYRVLGSMVGNVGIMSNFEDPDFDYHTYQAAHMYSVPYAAVTKKLRKAAKGINFGLPYGMGDESLGVRVYGEATAENTRKASALRQAYFKGQEDIRDWFEFHRNMGVREGYTETFFGRRRYYRKADFSEAAIRRQAGNQVIQGTAADIYKTAVGRMFKRICKEGWLGKVLFPGFIHDELLVEVSCDIDPMVWLKVAREEFEVKINNQDGSPWCPLYMGCGFGRSWYEAKSVEWAIRLQWESVEKYGVSGMPDWDGDVDKFCNKIPDVIRDFEVRDIHNQLVDENSQGKEIKPALNSAMLDLVKADSKLYKSALEELASVKDISTYTKEEIESYMDKKYHIQSVLIDTNGSIITQFEAPNETQACITMFCNLHMTDRNKVNLLSIADYNAEESNITSGNVMSDFEYEDEDEMSEDRRQKMIDTRVDTLGLYLDVNEKRIIMQMVPSQYMDFIKSHCNSERDGYQVRFKDMQEKKLYDCNAWVRSSEVNAIQSMYLQYLSALNKV